MRDDFSQRTLDTLARRVGFRCSNPACRKLTTGPRSDPSRTVSIGVGAHITAASEGGPRYDRNISGSTRSSAQNGIWLCQNCAKLVDNNSLRYSCSVLNNWKQRTEELTLLEIEGHAPTHNIKLEDMVDLEISYRKVKGGSERHDYVLEIRLRNLSNTTIDDYHVDVEFPSRVLERPNEKPFYVEGRSNRTVAFFRTAPQSRSVACIYPGDTVTVLPVPYYMDHEIYFQRGNLFAELVRATLYRQGFQPLAVEKPFGELQFF